MPVLHTNESVDLYWELFSRQGSFLGKQGNLLGEGEIGEATHADFSSSSPHFSIYFALFSLVSLFLMKGNFVHFVVPTTLKRGFALSDDGYRTIIYTQNFNIAEPLEKKKTCFSDTIHISKLQVFILLIVGIFFCLHFPSRIRPAQVSGPRFTDTHLFRPITRYKGTKDYHAIKQRKKTLQINHFMTFNIHLAFDRSKILNVSQIC